MSSSQDPFASITTTRAAARALLEALASEGPARDSFASDPVGELRKYGIAVSEGFELETCTPPEPEEIVRLLEKIDADELRVVEGDDYLLYPFIVHLHPWIGIVARIAAQPERGGTDSDSPA